MRLPSSLRALRPGRSRSGAPRRAWAWLVPVAVCAGVFLMVASATTARGTDLGGSRVVSVTQVVDRQQRTVATLSAKERALRDQISAATALAGVTDRRVAQSRSAANRLAGAAGLTPVTGATVTVALDDAPRARVEDDLAHGAQPDDLVIHQQDVQGVVNALWRGGARAMTIMGERVVATTAVRCVGNTLLLHGRVYSPPFTVTALGDSGRLQGALDADDDVQVFRQYVDAYGLGYSVAVSPRQTLPAYSGPLELTYARPAS